LKCEHGLPDRTLVNGGHLRLVLSRLGVVADIRGT